MQTIDQTAFFGKYSRWSFTVPTPNRQITPTFLLTTVDQLCNRATGSPAGAVHLNCMFREPLAPTGEDSDWSDYLAPVQSWIGSDRPYSAYLSPKHIDHSELEVLAEEIGLAKKGIIVAGPLPAWQDKSSILGLAARLGWPIFADIASGLRCGGARCENVLCHYDLFLRSENLRSSLAPDLILQFGSTPISKVLRNYLTQSGAPWIVVNDNPFRQDVEHQVTHRITAAAAVVAAAITRDANGCRSNLTESLVFLDKLTMNTLQDSVARHADQQLELAVTPEIFSQARDSRGIYLATSMPIRDAEAGVEQFGQKIFVASNRGVNGIDGTVASAVGFADGLQLPVTLAIGDVALLHDLNSLALIRQSRQPITIVVINNNGGGIFSFLPVAKVTAHFESYFGIPHGMTFERAAGQFGLPYSLSRNFSEFRNQLACAYMSNASQLIEVSSNRDLSLKQHERLWQEVTDSIRANFTLS